MEAKNDPREWSRFDFSPEELAELEPHSEIYDIVDDPLGGADPSRRDEPMPRPTIPDLPARIMALN